MTRCDKCPNQADWYVAYGCLKQHTFTSILCHSHTVRQVNGIHEDTIRCPCGEPVEDYLYTDVKTRKIRYAKELHVV